MITSLIIGDPHFKKNLIHLGTIFNEKVIDLATEKKPTFIVILGDILDTHCTVNVPAHNLAMHLIDQLSKISPVYLIIGNHDFINNKQFLTEKHVFNPLKKWPNVFVVDKPLTLLIGDDNETSFVFCPYTPPGRFFEALNNFDSPGYLWNSARAIFAHQEFKGCTMGSITGNKGDIWSEDFPPVISGHIHDAQTVGENIFYPGSPFQHSFGCSPNKKVWFVDWEKDGFPDYSFFVEKIDLQMKQKKIYSCKSMKEFYNLEFSSDFLNKIKSCDYKIKIEGTSEQFSKIKKSPFYEFLIKNGVIFDFTIAKTEEKRLNKNLKTTTYREILHELLSGENNDGVWAEYNLIINTDL